MGRKMIKTERIANEKTRLMTYKKRKACLLKKANEFSTLCGVDTCLIIYGPKRQAATQSEEVATQSEEVAEAETWPTDETKVANIINKYKDTSTTSCRKTSNINDFLSERINNLENKKGIKRKKMNKYCSWDDKLSGYSKQELCNILGAIDDKIVKAQSYVNVLEETKRQNWTLTEGLYEQQQLVPWGQLGLGFPFLHQCDQMMMKNMDHQVKDLMKYNNLGHGIYNVHQDPIQRQAYFDPNWVPAAENFVFNGILQFTGSDQM